MAAQFEPSGPYSLPSAPHLHGSGGSSSSKSQRKPWQSRRHPSFRSTKSQNCVEPEEEQRLSREQSRISTATRQAKWWKIRPFQGMIGDIKRRAPFYASDWKDAWDYRVVPATVYMYFAKYANNAASFSTIIPLNNVPYVVSFLLLIRFPCIELVEQGWRDLPKSQHSPCSSLFLGYVLENRLQLRCQ